MARNTTQLEEIVLLSPEGEAIGTVPKAAGHHRATPFHLAFSSYVIDDADRVLITRRAPAKRSFPGVWTNSCCGHPAPGENLRSAVRRRLNTELGLVVDELTLVLPAFEYRATAADGLVEYEWCPVVRARWSGGWLQPRSDEVAEASWRTWEECQALVDDPAASPWYRLQMAQLAPLGAPSRWPAADPALLPPALRW
jgi:isopentenyl-diphosphate Delta-isomerase